MSKLIYLGAIKKNTNQYVFPIMAKKTDDLVCPDCGNDVIIIQGDKYRHHFRHKTQNDERPCQYYDKPNESQIHKDAKILMKTLLENDTQIIFTRSCQSCNKSEKIKLPKLTDASIITLEHRFNYNNELKIADVAHTLNGEIKCIYEICHTHRTSLHDRPEPWIEVKAETLIRLANNRTAVTCVHPSYQYAINLPCERSKCVSCIVEEQKRLRLQQELQIQKEQQEKMQQEKMQQEMKQREIYKRKNTMNLMKGLNRINYIYMQIPFSQNDDIKKKGGKWDSENKLWYISCKEYKKYEDELEQYVVWWVCKDCENKNGICDDCWNDIGLPTRTCVLTTYSDDWKGNPLKYMLKFGFGNNLLNKMKTMQYLNPVSIYKGIICEVCNDLIKAETP